MMTRLHLSAVAVAAAITVFATGGSMAAAAPPPLPNLVRNGSLEHPRIRAGSTAAFASIPGWRLAFGTAIEIQNHVAGAAAVGDQLVELDSDASSGIYQRILTRPNRLYRIQFFFSPRPGTSAAENVLVVKWHRRVVATLRADGTGLVNTSWRMYAIKVRATGRTTRLELDDAGISDSVGTLIDGVTVTRWRGHPTGARNSRPPSRGIALAGPASGSSRKPCRRPALRLEQPGGGKTCD